MDEAKPVDLCRPDKITAVGTMTTMSTTSTIMATIIQKRRERCFCRLAARRGASMVRCSRWLLRGVTSVLRGNEPGRQLLKQTHSPAASPLCRGSLRLVAIQLHGRKSLPPSTLSSAEPAHLLKHSHGCFSRGQPLAAGPSRNSYVRLPSYSDHQKARSRTAHPLLPKRGAHVVAADGELGRRRLLLGRRK